MSPRRMVCNRVGVGGTVTRGPVDGTGEHGERAGSLEPAGSIEEYRQRDEDELQEGAPRSAPYQPPAEESVPAVEPVAIDEGQAPVMYPLASLAIPTIVRRSVAGLSFSGIMREFPGATAEAMEQSVARALEAGSITFYMSDDDPPVRVYVDAPTMREAPAEPVASAVAGEPDPPTVAECVAAYRFRVDNYHGAVVSASDARAALREAEAAEDVAHVAMVRSVDRLARCIDDKQVEIDGEHWRAVRPRKPRGKPVDPGALWGLERVEVAK